MAIEELIQVIAPPKSPVDKGNPLKWDSIQRRARTPLPDDLRDYGIFYGTGAFVDGEIYVVNPFDSHYQDYIDRELRDFRPIKETSTSDIFPYDMFPDAPGLLPWGSDQNGNRLFWLTAGEPMSWPVMVWDRGGPFQRFEMSMTTFLAKALTNEINVAIWEPFAESERNFTPGY